MWRGQQHGQSCIQDSSIGAAAWGCDGSLKVPMIGVIAYNANGMILTVLFHLHANFIFTITFMVLCDFHLLSFDMLCIDFFDCYCSEFEGYFNHFSSLLIFIWRIISHYNVFIFTRILELS